MAQTYSSKGKVFLTQHQFDSRKDAGTLQTGIEYMIIDDPNTIELSDGSISLLASNGVMIIGKSAEEPYLTIGQGNQVLVDNPQVAKQVANKEYVDSNIRDLENAKQNKLTASNPIYISDDGGTISFQYGHGLNKISVTDSNGEVTATVLGVDCDTSSPLYINDNSKLSLKCSSPLYINSSDDNKLSVNISELASNIAGGGLYESSNKLNVNIDTIFNEVLYDGEGKPKTTGLSYDSTTTTLKVATGYGLNVNSCNILYVDAGTIAGRGLAYDNGKINSDTYTTTSSTVTISDKTLTTIRATSSTIHFNNLNWVELTITRDGNNYSCWGMAQDKATTCNQYIYTVVGNTTNGAVTLDSTAFITETKVR